MMNLVYILYGYLAWNLAQVTRVVPENLTTEKTLENYMIFITKYEIDDFFSKQIFEEKS